MLAVAQKQKIMVNLCLKDKNININTKDPQTGINAAWFAAFYGHGEILNILANAGADIECSNHKGVNILHLAVEKCYYEIVKMLIESDFPINQSTHSGLTPLYIAI